MRGATIALLPVLAVFGCSGLRLSEQPSLALQQLLSIYGRVQKIPRGDAPGGDCSRPKFAYQPGTQDLFDRRCESHGASCLPYAAQPSVGRIPNIQTRCRRMARPRSRGRRFDSISLTSNQSMKPTAPLRYNFSVFATTPSTSSRLPASLVRFVSSRSRTPAVLFLTIAVAYLVLVRRQPKAESK